MRVRREKASCVRNAVMGAVLGVALVPVAGYAQEREVPADLPSTDLVRSWLERDADVMEATAGLDIAAAEAQQLRVSPNEWSVGYQKSRRRFTTGPDSNEWTAQLQRTLRLPNKWLIDRGLANTREDLAGAAFGEALHESARSLVELWSDWQEATQLRNLLEEQVRVVEENVRAVDARLRSGDAARLDLNLAEADAAEVQRRSSEVRVEQIKARARFEERFGSGLETPLPPGEPTAIGGTIGSWRDRIVEQADELKMAQFQLDMARDATSRARADRIPDPTVGVYTARETFSNEKLVGVSVSIPLSGRYRSARAAQALGESRAAQARLERTQKEVATRIAETYAEAVGSYERWQLAETAAQKAAESAQLTLRAYTLGETDVQTLILARRQALDAAEKAVQARVAARRGHNLLLVDAHLIWDLDHE